MKSYRTIFSLAVLMMMSLLPGTGMEAAATDGQDYVFQVDDQFSRLAEKYYGTPLAYPAIVEATNARVSGGSGYVTITEPNHILVGQKLFVPAMDEVPEALLAEVPLGEGPMSEDVTVIEIEPSPEQLRLLAGLDSKGAPPELVNEVWLNSDPLKLADLRGKVVLVEFWTYG